MSQVLTKQQDNQKYPGLIRLTVEQIFAFINDDEQKDFLLTLSYVEISGSHGDESIYDLMDNGKQTELHRIKMANVLSVKHFFELKAESEKYLLSSQIGRVDSTLLLQLRIESCHQSSI